VSCPLPSPLLSCECNLNVIRDFRYKDATTVEFQQTIGVFGRSSGVPVVTGCHVELQETGLTVLPNCYVEHAATNDSIGDCGIPNACAGENGCCGRPLASPVPDVGCQYGVRCSNSVLTSQPNSRAMCNADRCGCNTRWHTASTCTELVGTDCKFNAEQCHVECSDDPNTFYSVANLRFTETDTIQHQSWQYGPSTDDAWYTVEQYFDGHGQSQLSMQGVGYGQLVWTVRGPQNAASPSDLNVEVHILPITGDEPGLASTFSTITITPRANCQGDGCQIYETSVKLGLNTDWFFYKMGLDASLYDAALLTGLKDTDTWCVGVNTSIHSPIPNNIEIGLCGSPDFLDDWFYDGITTRMHITSNPFMCPTLVGISNSTTAMYDASRIRDGDLTAAYSDVGGNLLWLPCTPCNIGAERQLLPDTESGDTSQFIQISSGLASYGDGQPISTTLFDGAVHAVMTRTGSDDYAGFMFDADFNCVTITSNDTVEWRPCDPSLMFAHTSALCASTPQSFSIGIFQYICTQGFGGSVQKIAIDPPGCLELGNGQLDSGLGYGAVVSNDGTITHSGLGYTSGETILPDGATTCRVIVSTNKVLIQPISDTTGFNVASTNVEIINTTAFTGFFSVAYEREVYTQRIVLHGAMTTLLVVAIFFAVALSILIVVLIMYEDELNHEILKRLEG